MTDTETPIEAGARELHDRTYAGLDVRPWDMRTDAGRERFLGDARVVFASLDVEGLAGVLRAHRLARWEVELREWWPDKVTLVCSCGETFQSEDGEQETVEEYLEGVHDGHQAAAQVAWLSGGGA